VSSKQTLIDNWEGKSFSSLGVEENIIVMNSRSSLYSCHSCYADGIVSNIQLFSKLTLQSVKIHKSKPQYV